MRWTDTVSMAWRAIVAQRGRSVLTLLGTYCMHEAPRAAAPARFAKGVKP